MRYSFRNQRYRFSAVSRDKTRPSIREVRAAESIAHHGPFDMEYVMKHNIADLYEKDGCGGCRTQSNHDRIIRFATATILLFSRTIKRRDRKTRLDPNRIKRHAK